MELKTSCMKVVGRNQVEDSMKVVASNQKQGEEVKTTICQKTLAQLENSKVKIWLGAI